jgi:LmbE family N-acetylglucosaminyl deacetylase
MKNILVLSPHTDDMEFGCGGTIKRLADEGCKISVLIFSSCEQSLPKDFSVDDIKNEQFNASRVIGVSEENITMHDFPVRQFDSYRQDILEILIQYKNDNNISQVFTPSRADIHQDHAVICSESIRAFKNISLLGYELPWNNLTSDHNFFYSLSPEHIRAKEKAIDCFKSQHHRAYNSKDINSLAKVRGMQIKSDYAEAFDMIRWVEM